MQTMELPQRTRQTSLPGSETGLTWHGLRNSNMHEPPTKIGSRPQRGLPKIWIEPGGPHPRFG